ncbi:MAG: ribulose-phosphate 3-epimerase, partial [Gammaproteobacteria bacterium]
KNESDPHHYETVLAAFRAELAKANI